MSLAVVYQYATILVPAHMLSHPFLTLTPGSWWFVKVVIGCQQPAGMCNQGQPLNCLFVQPPFRHLTLGEVGRGQTQIKREKPEFLSWGEFTQPAGSVRKPRGDYEVREKAPP